MLCTQWPPISALGLYNGPKASRRKPLNSTKSNNLLFALFHVSFWKGGGGLLSPCYTPWWICRYSDFAFTRCILQLAFEDPRAAVGRQPPFEWVHQEQFDQGIQFDSRQHEPFDQEAIFQGITLPNQVGAEFVCYLVIERQIRFWGRFQPCNENGSIKAIW